MSGQSDQYFRIHFGCASFGLIKSKFGQHFFWAFFGYRIESLKTPSPTNTGPIELKFFV